MSSLVAIVITDSIAGYAISIIYRAAGERKMRGIERDINLGFLPHTLASRLAGAAADYGSALNSASADLAVERTQMPSR